MKILKNGNVAITQVIGTVQNFPVPSIKTNDMAHDTIWLDGYNAALDDVTRQFKDEMDRAPKSKIYSANKQPK